MDIFDDLKRLGLPEGNFLITGSGPLGIKGIRQINDVDIVVTGQLWDNLESKYGIIIQDGVKKISIPGTSIEVLGEGSAYFGDEEDIRSRIKQAENIDGMPFERREKVISIKRQLGRKKDLVDTELIEEFLSQ